MKLTEATATSERQELLDTFYHRNGPCCAGCDWWHSLNSLAGECRRSTIVPGSERADTLGMSNVTMRVPAGHPLTDRRHLCGEFKDDFDWSSLPLPYRKRVGDPSLAAGRSALASTGERDG